MLFVCFQDLCVHKILCERSSYFRKWKDWPETTLAAVQRDTLKDSTVLWRGGSPFFEMCFQSKGLVSIK